MITSLDRWFLTGWQPMMAHCGYLRFPMPEIYVSTDVEADGPIPGPNSMLSFGSAAFLPDKTMVATFSANLTALPGAQPDPRTMEWWKEKPAAWAACRENQRDPAAVMPEYVAWLKSLRGRPVFVGYPAAYDFLFIYWYLMRFAGESPFSHSALDIKTYAMAILGTEYRESVKKNMPRAWFGEQPHTHVALDDAIGQGILFCNMLAAHRRGASRKTLPAMNGACPRMQFEHVGIVTDEPHEEERWVAATRAWVTDFTVHPFRIEWLRFAADTPVQGPVRHQPHVAFRVDDIEVAAAGLKVLLPPFDAGPRIVGFYQTTDGAVVELLRYKRSDRSC